MTTDNAELVRATPVSSELEAMRKERDEALALADVWTVWAEGLSPAEISNGQNNLASALAEAKAEIAEANRKLDVAREALRRNFCPRPANNRPDDFTVGQCFDAGECGCTNGDALSQITNAEGG